MHINEAMKRAAEIEERFYCTAEPVSMEDEALVGRVKRHWSEHGPKLLEALRAMLDKEQRLPADIAVNAADLLLEAEEIEEI